MLTLEQINDYLSKGIGSYYFPEIRSEKADFEVGQTVYYGQKYTPNGFSIVPTKIVKIGNTKKSKIFKTDSGFNFTTTYGEVSSTQKHDNRYLRLFDIKEGEKIILKELEEREMREARVKYEELKTLVHNLDPKKDNETIARLIELLTD